MGMILQISIVGDEAVLDFKPGKKATTKEHISILKALAHIQEYFENLTWSQPNSV